MQTLRVRSPLDLAHAIVLLLVVALVAVLVVVHVRVRVDDGRTFAHAQDDADHGEFEHVYLASGNCVVDALGTDDHGKILCLGPKEK